MKKVILFAVLILVCVALVGTAFAVKTTKVIETSNGNVTLSADAHKAKGIGCMDCHKSTFKMAAGALEMKFPHKAGESCSVCHDGTKAFKDCGKCHIK